MDAKLPVRSTTQNQIPVEDIQEDLIILKDGSCCLVLQVAALNFSLLSEAEQESIIYSYAALLNSLTFPIQLLIRSEQKDISSYLKILLQAENDQKNQLLKNQINHYRKFVEEMVKKNNVLDKNFYVVIPFFAIELGLKSSASFNLFSKSQGLPYSKNFLIERAKINLYPKKDHLVRQFARIGLSVVQLTTQELLSLFHSIYNASHIGEQRIIEGAQYESLLVQSVKKIPTLKTNSTNTSS